MGRPCVSGKDLCLIFCSCIVDMDDSVSVSTSNSNNLPSLVGECMAYACHHLANECADCFLTADLSERLRH